MTELSFYQMCAEVGWRQPTFLVIRDRMLTNDVITKLETIVQELAAREGCELYDLDFGAFSGRRTLRIFIDKASPGGAAIGDCTKVSRGLSELLDAEDPIPGGEYDLEVSTPGVDRLLRKPWHFERVVGKKIQLRLSEPLESFGIQNKKFSAMKAVTEVLVSSDDNGIVLAFEDEMAKIPFSALEKAKVFFELEPKGEKKGEKKKSKK